MLWQNKELVYDGGVQQYFMKEVIREQCKLQIQIIQAKKRVSK